MKSYWILCYCILTTFVYGQEVYTDNFGIEFVRIPKGEYISGRFQPTVSNMVLWGSDLPLDESMRQEAVRLAARDARPGFRVQIKKPYYIGKYEVTQGQWSSVIKKNPSFFQNGKVMDQSDLHPVENVTWMMAQRFIKKLNRLEKKYAHYRLPTEFEWEYAARAGITEDISWDKIQSSAVIACQSTSMVGQKNPNSWGIYDMLGNVWEWTRDYYNEKLFADELSPDKGKQHVLKGASFFGDVKNATYMTHAGGPGSGYDVGFRLVMELKRDP